MLPRLPIFATLIGAYAVIVRNVGAIVRATVLPLIVLIVISTLAVAFDNSIIVGILTKVISLPFIAICAVAIHRTVLLGPESLVNPWSLSWSNRETSFLVWLIILGVTFYLAGIAFLMVGWMLPDLWMYAMAALTFGLWIEGRFSMVLPATAIDRNMFMSQSWYLTSGNNLQLILVLGIPLLLAYGVIFILSTPVSPLGTAANSMIMLTWVALTLAVEIAVLSLSYQYLSSAAETA